MLPVREQSATNDLVREGQLNRVPNLSFLNDSEFQPRCGRGHRRVSCAEPWGEAAAEPVSAQPVFTEGFVDKSGLAVQRASSELAGMIQEFKAHNTNESPRTRLAVEDRDP